MDDIDNMDVIDNMEDINTRVCDNKQSVGQIYSFFRCLFHRDIMTIVSNPDCDETFIANELAPFFIENFIIVDDILYNVSENLTLKYIGKPTINLVKCIIREWVRLFVFEST
jgi:hypothetical protein